MSTQLVAEVDMARSSSSGYRGPMIHIEVFNGNLEIFDEVLSPNYVRHCQSMPPGLQETRDTAVFKAFVADFVNAVSDCKVEIGFIISRGHISQRAKEQSGWH